MPTAPDHAKMTTAHVTEIFKVRSIAQHLEVVDDSSMTIKTSHTFILEALQCERFFRRRFTWTGSGIEKDPIITSGKDELGHSHKLHGPVIREGKTRFFFVDLGRELSPGEEEIIHIEHTFIDVSRTFEPFLGVNIHDGCDDLELRVTLPSVPLSPVFRECWHEGSNTAHTRDVIEPRTINREDVECFEYSVNVPNPTAGKKYRIAWSRPTF